MPALHALHDSREAEPTEEDSPVEQAEQFVDPVLLLNRPAVQLEQVVPVLALP